MRMSRTRVIGATLLALGLVLGMAALVAAAPPVNVSDGRPRR